MYTVGAPALCTILSWLVSKKSCVESTNRLTTSRFIHMLTAFCMENLHDLPTAVPHWARPRSRNVQHRVLLGDAWSPSELRQAPGAGKGLYMVTTWYVVETIGGMMGT